MITSKIYKNHSIQITQDEFPENPRDWENLGTMVCFHSKYNLGDKDHGFTPESLVKKIKQADIISLPIFLFDHSGLTISTDDTMFRAMDSHGWDWGKIGYIFVSLERVREEYKKKLVSKKLRETVLTCLRNEVETYNQYLQGEVFYYEILNSEGKSVDGCSGFYGLEDCIHQAELWVDHN